MRQVSFHSKVLQIIGVTFLGITLLTVNVFAFETIDFDNEIRAGLSEPIDTAVSDDGTIYVLDTRQCMVFMFDPSGYGLGSFGDCGSKDGELRRPEAITVDSTSRVLVADTGNNRVVIFDKNGEYLSAFGNSGSRRGEMSKPTGIAVDVQDQIYVADSYNERVQVFSPQGVYRGMFKTDSRPRSVAVDHANAVYILLPEESQIMYVNLATKTTRRLQCVTSGKNYLKEATDLSVDFRGDIYITEEDEHSIKKFDANEDILATFGSEGEGRGQFDVPAGITADENGRIYVADQDNGRIQVFEVKGSSKSPLDTDSIMYPPGVDFKDQITAQEDLSDILADDKGTFALSNRNDILIHISDGNRVIGGSGRDEGEFSDPEAIDRGPKGYLYVADTGNDRVQVFDPDGNFIFTFGQRGQKTGQFNDPKGIAVSSKDMIYVADTGNHRIQIFNKDGIFLKAFGEQSRNGSDELPPSSTFRYPTALAINSKGALFVLDSGNNRIQIFDEHGTFTASVGGPGESYKEFDRPTDIALTSSDVLVVADAGNHRIQLIHPDIIKHPFVFGSPAEGYGEFSSLSGVDVKGADIYVTDADSSKVRIFSILEGRKGRPKKKTPQKVEPKLEVKEEPEEEFELK